MCALIYEHLIISLSLLVICLVERRNTSAESDGQGSPRTELLCRCEERCKRMSSCFAELKLWHRYIASFTLGPLVFAHPKLGYAYRRAYERTQREYKKKNEKRSLDSCVRNTVWVRYSMWIKLPINSTSWLGPTRPRLRACSQAGSASRPVRTDRSCLEARSSRPASVHMMNQMTNFWPDKPIWPNFIRLMWTEANTRLSIQPSLIQPDQLIVGMIHVSTVVEDFNKTRHLCKLVQSHRCCYCNVIQ